MQLSKKKFILLLTINGFYLVASFEEYVNFINDEHELGDLKNRSNPYRIPGENSKPKY